MQLEIPLVLITCTGDIPNENYTAVFIKKIAKAASEVHVEYPVSLDLTMCYFLQYFNLQAPLSSHSVPFKPTCPCICTYRKAYSADVATAVTLTLYGFRIENSISAHLGS